MAYRDLIFDTNRRVPHVWNKIKYHSKYGKPVSQVEREVLYAYQLGPLTAAVAAHGVTNVWQGIPVIPLADNDEIHAIWLRHPRCDYTKPIGVRWGLIPNNDTSASTITTTYATVDMGATHAGSDLAADGGTALTQTIAAVTAADTTTSKPFMSQIGTIEGLTADFDILNLKLVSTGNSSADRLRVWCLEIFYHIK